MPGDQHRRQLIGMQRGLDVDFFAALGAIVEADDAAHRTQRGRNQRMGLGLHDQLSLRQMQGPLTALSIPSRSASCATNSPALAESTRSSSPSNAINGLSLPPA